MLKATRRVPNPSIESASLARFAFQLQCERLGKGTTSAADLRCILCHMVDRWRNCLFPGHISTYFTMHYVQKIRSERAFCDGMECAATLLAAFSNFFVVFRSAGTEGN